MLVGSAAYIGLSKASPTHLYRLTLDLILLLSYKGLAAYYGMWVTNVMEDGRLWRWAYGIHFFFFMKSLFCELGCSVVLSIATMTGIACPWSCPRSFKSDQSLSSFHYSLDNREVTVTLVTIASVLSLDIGLSPLRWHVVVKKHAHCRLPSPSQGAHLPAVLLQQRHTHLQAHSPSCVSRSHEGMKSTWFWGVSS